MTLGSKTAALLSSSGLSKLWTRSLTMGGYSEEPDEPLGKFMQSGVAAAEKISLTANVTLRAASPAVPALE